MKSLILFENFCALFLYNLYIKENLDKQTYIYTLYKKEILSITNIFILIYFKNDRLFFNLNYNLLFIVTYTSCVSNKFTSIANHYYLSVKYTFLTKPNSAYSKNFGLVLFVKWIILLC